jgi:hypothetical protein
MKCLRYFQAKNDFILGDADYRWGFTTMDNTAEYTAKVVWLATHDTLELQET